MAYQLTSELTPPSFYSTYTPPYTSSYPTNTYQLPQPVSSALTRSRIMEQNKYAPNEPLYNPLKNAVGTDLNRV